MNKKNYNIEFSILMEVITELAQISKEELISKTRKRPIVELRMICSNVLKENNLKISVQAIGEFINIDHSTVVYHIKTHDTLMGQKDGQYKMKFERINTLYKNRMLMSSENLKSRLIDRRKKLERELSEVNDMLKTIEEEEKELKY